MWSTTSPNAVTPSPKSQRNVVMANVFSLKLASNRRVWLTLATLRSTPAMATGAGLANTLCSTLRRSLESTVSAALSMVALIACWGTPAASGATTRENEASCPAGRVAEVEQVTTAPAGVQAQSPPCTAR